MHLYVLITVLKGHNLFPVVHPAASNEVFNITVRDNEMDG